MPTAYVRHLVTQETYWVMENNSGRLLQIHGPIRTEHVKAINKPRGHCSKCRTLSWAFDEIGRNGLFVTIEPPYPGDIASPQAR